MSCYEWEHGTITLPAAVVPALKKTLREYNNAVRDEVRVEAVRIHKEVAKSTRSLALYRSRLRVVDEAKWAAERSGRDNLGRSDLVQLLARQVMDSMLRAADRAGAPAHQPTAADVNRVVPALTNRDNTFAVYGADGFTAATITFDGRNVTWSVQENNHAVDYARSAPLAGLFFAALKNTVWTARTGGSIVGNNEYNQDGDTVGSGGNYLVETFGPIGDTARVSAHMRNGFSRTAATKLVADSKRQAASGRRRVW